MFSPGDYSFLNFILIPIQKSNHELVNPVDLIHEILFLFLLNFTKYELLEHLKH